MKVPVSVVAAAMFSAAALVSGCSSVDPSVTPPEISNVQYELAQGRTFVSVVRDAATRRRWSVQALADGTVRCTIVQREHRVVADVVPGPGSTFSIRCVESNIPVKKYNQWAENLRRDIVFLAAR